MGKRINWICLPLALTVSALFTFTASAATRYVNANNTTPVSPYTNWNTAATNIQHAVNVSLNGDLVLVTNGIYYNNIAPENRLHVQKVITVESVNGPAFTFIEGGGPNGSKRCVFLMDGAKLSGFTLRNGYGSEGGGAKCNSTSAIITNCIMTGNFAGFNGGGVFSGTLFNCVLSNNVVLVSGGGGGGACQSILVNCVLSGNTAPYHGGGAYASTLTNCLLSSNSATLYFGGGSINSSLVNCTVVGNSAGQQGGGVYGGTLLNCIVYYNNVTGPGSSSNYANVNLTNTCTAPFPGGSSNTDKPPRFADLDGGDFRLNPASPCVNFGNSAFVSQNTDLDGNSRFVGSSVDVGAYELPSLVHFVRQNNFGASPPYTNWATAAQTIQNAIDVANPGAYVVVSNGTYNTGGKVIYGTSMNRVAVDKAITLQSVNGPNVTLIEGIGGSSFGSGTRCVYLTNGASLIGFTLTNGAARTSGNITNEQSGGGVWCESIAATISNCVITRNYSAQKGGGAYQGSLFDCIITNNSVSLEGGGTYYASLKNCLVVNNKTMGGSGKGGGAYSSALTNCVVSNNVAVLGGGLFLGSADYSLISSNRAFNSGGGVYSNALVNCVLKNNLASSAGGAFNGGGAFDSALVSCTVVSNTAGNGVTSGTGGGTYGGTATNSVIYHNLAESGKNFFGGTITYCDTFPLAVGTGNFTNEPAFLELAIGDLRLQSNSPCINSGKNSYAPAGPDLDGNPRIVGGTVDVGAYEFQTPSSILSYAWAQQYGLPTDGSADYADTDGDGLNNWQEWRTGTIPTNNLSVLQMESPSNSVSGIAVSWKSVSGVTYFLDRSTNLGAQPQFLTIKTNILGQPTTTTYTDTNAIDDGPFFYRVGVQD